MGILSSVVAKLAVSRRGRGASCAGLHQYHGHVPILMPAIPVGCAGTYVVASAKTSSPPYVMSGHDSRTADSVVPTLVPNCATSLSRGGGMNDVCARLPRSEWSNSVVVAVTNESTIPVAALAERSAASSRVRSTTSRSSSDSPKDCDVWDAAFACAVVSSGVMTAARVCATISMSSTVRGGVRLLSVVVKIDRRVVLAFLLRRGRREPTVKIACSASAWRPSASTSSTWVLTRSSSLVASLIADVALTATVNTVTS